MPRLTNTNNKNLSIFDKLSSNIKLKKMSFKYNRLNRRLQKYDDIVNKGKVIKMEDVNNLTKVKKEFAKLNQTFAKDVVNELEHRSDLDKLPKVIIDTIGDFI